METKRNIVERLVNATSLTENGKEKAIKILMARTIESLKGLETRAYMTNADYVVFVATGIINSAKMKHTRTIEDVKEAIYEYIGGTRQSRAIAEMIGKPQTEKEIGEILMECYNEYMDCEDADEFEPIAERTAEKIMNL